MRAGSSELCVRIVHHRSRTSITVEGELNLANRSVLRSHLDYVITDADGDIELDLANVTYINGSGLGEILGADAELLGQGRHLRVINPSPQVVRLFELCVITHLLDGSATPADRPSTARILTAPEGCGSRPGHPATPGRAAVHPLIR
jgi:anti-sigma B factor antagonist